MAIFGFLKRDLNLTERSSEFKAFYESVFGNRNRYWRDGPNINSLLSLNRNEKNLAEKILLQRLTSENYLENSDSFVIECLGVLHSKIAEKPLKQLINNCHYSLVPSCSLALWRICKYKESIDKLNVLRKHIDEFVRINVIVALGQINHIEAESALLDSLYDSEHLVRYNALRFLARDPGSIECCNQASDITKDESFNNRIEYNIKVSDFLNKNKKD